MSRVSGQVPHSRPLHDEEDVAAAAAALRSQMVAAGALERELEERIAARFGAPHASTAASGTLALVGALRALDVQPGDDVVLPTYVCAEVADAALYLGARPVLCDVDSDTFAPNAEILARALTPRAKAMIVPHMFGIPARVRETLSLGVPVVEDLAQGLGAVDDGRPAGGWGAVAILSFKAIKMVSAGEGGAVVVNDAQAARRLQTLHRREDPSLPTFDFPMSDLAASVALAQWEKLPEFVERRRVLARNYQEFLHPLERFGLALPADVPGHAWFRYPLMLPEGLDSSKLIGAMAERGIHVRRPVDCLLHRRLGLPADDFPVAERLFARTLSLPIYPALAATNQERIAAALKGALAA